MQLPSNKIGGLLVTVVVVVVLVIVTNILLEKFDKGHVPEIVDADLILQRKTTDKSSIDSDNDGLLDWQEEFYGSDPNNPDTDGDGTNDGDEIKQDRDPTIPGPNDALISSSRLVDADFEATGYVPGTLTDNISVNFFANYLNLKKDNNLTPQSGSQLINQVTEEIEQQTAVTNLYSVSNLNSVSTNKETITNYANTFARIYLDYLKQVDALKTLDDDTYINRFSELYQSFAKTMSNIETPDAILNTHVQIVNRIHNAGVLVKQIKDHEETDPVKSLFYIQEIRKNSDGETGLYSNLVNYFEDNGVTFSSNEIVRFWNYYK